MKMKMKIKMHSLLKHITILLLCCSMVGITGCGRRSKPSTFYLLSSLPTMESTRGQADTDKEKGNKNRKKSRQLSLSIGPVRLPAYLDRKQILVRLGNNELDIREYSRWGEPLQDNFQRVLINNLSVLLKTPQVASYDNRDVKDADFQLIVDVLRFDVSDNGEAVLVAFWTLNNRRGKQLLRDKTSLHLKSPSMEPEDIVKALNQLVVNFSNRLAGAIGSVK